MEELNIGIIIAVIIVAAGIKVLFILGHLIATDGQYVTIKMNDKTYEVFGDKIKNKVELFLRILFCVPFIEIVVIAAFILYGIYRIFKWIIVDSAGYMKRQFDWYANLPDE